MHLRILLAAAAALVSVSNADDMEAERIRCDDAVCTDEASTEEAEALRAELLQTAVELKRSKGADAPGLLHDLQIETQQAESARREALRRQADAMAAETNAAEALKGRVPETTSAAPSEEQPNAAPAKHGKHHHGGGQNKLLEEAMIPAGALVTGVLLLACELTTAGILAIYFGAQAGFTLYMKVVLSGSVISKELGIDGVPAGFLVTAVQQVVAFGVMAVIVAVMYFTPWRYTPRRLKTWSEVSCVILFSFAFSVNIGLNNFSLSLLAVSLNMIIRSCLPIVTLAFQQLLGPCMPELSSKEVRMTEVALMVAGVVFAAVATVAKSEGSHHGSESKNLWLGVFVCTLSDAACAINLILGNMFGSSLDPPLNPVDTIFYMALPCALFLLPASLLLMHPVEWPNVGDITDLQVFQKVFELSPTTMLWVVLSGCIAAGYNVLQYTVVQRLSASHAAFAGNFNKAATIMLSICMGLETLPGGVWSAVMLLAILGNIGAFTGFSLLKSNEKAIKKDGTTGTSSTSVAAQKTEDGTTGTSSTLVAEDGTTGTSLVAHKTEAEAVESDKAKA